MGENVVGQVAAIWDGQAAHFDDEPDHGLRDDAVRRAWIDHLRSWLPEPPADLVDLGCGTGSLSVLLAEQGHRVVGVDASPQMIQQARRKAAAAGVTVTFHVADATAPPVEPTSMDVVLVRHLVWTLPDPHSAMRRPWPPLCGRGWLSSWCMTSPRREGCGAGPSPMSGSPWSLEPGRSRRSSIAVIVRAHRALVSRITVTSIE